MMKGRLSVLQLGVPKRLLDGSQNPEYFRRYYLGKKDWFFEYNKKWRKEHPDVAKHHRDKYNASHPEIVWKTHIKASYGLTPDEVRQMLNEQDTACAICHGAFNQVKVNRGTKIDFVVDHDKNIKRSQSVRGLLCPVCNMGLGFFADSIDNLRNAIAYLQEFKVKQGRMK